MQESPLSSKLAKLSVLFETPVLKPKCQETWRFI
jgi:hypothetical protein